MNNLVKRNKKVMFYGILNAGTTLYHRMKGFTDSSISKNSKEYSRQYVDEDFEQTDVTGYSPSMSYAFDQYTENLVHDDIVSITDNEKMGADAVRSIINVDFTKSGLAANSFVAIKRDFAVIPDSEGDSTDAYTYSGNLKVKGEKVIGEITSIDNFQTITFIPGTGVLQLATFSVKNATVQIAGATIVISNQTLVTNDNGIANIELGTGTYPYIISKTGYTDKTGSMVIVSSPVYKAETIVV